MLYQFAVVDVGASSIPSGDLVGLISNGYGADAKPAILAVPALQAVLAFIIFAGVDAMGPLGQAGLLVVGMNIVEPTKSSGGIGKEPVYS
jgi:hypothetical protein